VPASRRELELDPAAGGRHDVGEDGEIYVSNRTTAAGAGQLLRITS